LRTTPVLLSIITAIAVTLTACSDNPSTPPDPTPVDNTPNTTKFDVEWSPKAVVFKGSDLADLQRIDSAAFKFYFAPNSTKASGLTKGSILVLNNYAIRKVTSLQTVGGSLVVSTEPAEITEAMTRADIQWNHGIDVSPAMLAKSFGKMAGAVTTGTADSIVVSFSTGNFSVEFNIKHEGSESKIKGKLTKKHFTGGGSKSAMFTMNGTLRKFRSVGSIQIRDGQVTQFDVDNNGVNADFTFTAVAAGSGNDLAVEIPVPMLKFPLPELPFLIFDLKALIVLNAVIPTDGSCDIGMRVQYNSDQGFAFEPQTKNIKPRSNVDWKGFTPTKPPQTAASGPIAVSFGMAYPRMELSIVGTKTAAWVQSAGLIGGDFTMFPVCRQAKASAILAGGLTVGVTGLNTGIKKTLWQKDTTFLKVGDCPP
jgi:hypothetical protein